MSPTLNADATVSMLDAMQSGLEKALANIIVLRSTLVGETFATDFDPKDPGNKVEVGGLMKFTPRGVEICYRLFDEGKSRYAVAALMDISFGAADHRYKAWEKAGGLNRVKQPLD